MSYAWFVVPLDTGGELGGKDQIDVTTIEDGGIEESHSRLGEERLKGRIRSAAACRGWQILVEGQYDLRPNTEVTMGQIRSELKISKL